jgi:hypothetical protein
MDISHDHTNFGHPNSVFGLWEPTPKSVYFHHLYKISDRLMGHMTYFMFEPPSAQPRDPENITNFFKNF